METPASLFESVIERVESYGRTTFELAKLRLVEKISLVVTYALSKLGVIILIGLSMLVLSIGIAQYLGEILGKSYYGFFIVAGFYLFSGILSHFFLHRWIKKPVSEIIIGQTLK
jgi:hypothetical protein